MHARKSSENDRNSFAIVDSNQSQTHLSLECVNLEVLTSIATNTAQDHLSLSSTSTSMDFNQISLWPSAEGLQVLGFPQV